MKRIVMLLVVAVFLVSCSNEDSKKVKMTDLSGVPLETAKQYAKEQNLILEIEYLYHEEILSDKVISQSIGKGSTVKSGNTLKVTVSKGPIPASFYRENKINELGNVPIMMYHDIVNISNEKTIYTGGNVDKNGYNRTAEAFKSDLENYYQKGYRMISLDDYMKGIIDVPLGYSPIILTFDDGNKSNMNILGLDDKGDLIIDPNSAIGILELFKSKYPDYNVTATFFLNSGLFGQSKYNDKILKWLVEHNYDIGNHTNNHIDFSKVDAARTQSEIANMYKLLDSIIPNQYLSVIALPFGSPYKKTHANFPYIIEGQSEGYHYITNGTLQVGWDANYSPFHKAFDATFMKRVRAWDNNGEEFDIAMVFKTLENTRYISDGNKDTIVIPDDSNLNINIKDKKIIKY